VPFIESGVRDLDQPGAERLWPRARVPDVLVALAGDEHVARTPAASSPGAVHAEAGEQRGADIAAQPLDLLFDRVLRLRSLDQFLHV
jgi:hypothetical protein